MSRSSVKAEQRRRALLGLLSRRSRVSTMKMAGHFGVNPMTIRRDLETLEETGAVVRCHGGAMAGSRITFEFAFDERRRRHLSAKRRIGSAAARRITPGDTAFLDTGTTTLEAARALAKLDVRCTVVTSSLVIASELWNRGNVELLLVGGRVRRGSPDLIGPSARTVLEGLTAAVALLGSDGIDPARGSFAEDIETAQVAECMARNARKTIVLADASKLGAAGSARYLHIQQMDELISDRRANSRIVNALRHGGVTVTLT